MQLIHAFENHEHNTICTSKNVKHIYPQHLNCDIFHKPHQNFHLHPHPIDWLHLESSFEMVTGKQQNGTYLPLIPANTFKNKIRAEFNISKWLKKGYTSLTVTSTMKQNNVGQFETPTDGYNLVSFGLGGDVNLSSFKFNTYLSVTNLFNTKYIPHLSRLKPDGILNPGRNIVVGINFKI